MYDIEDLIGLVVVLIDVENRVGRIVTLDNSFGFPHPSPIANRSTFYSISRNTCARPRGSYLIDTHDSTHERYWRLDYRLDRLVDDVSW